MTFQDIFKSSYLDNMNSVSITDMTLAFMLALGIGVLIFLVYKRTFQGVIYSSGFGVTLIALTLISTFVILAVTSNVVLSLGMVGALSIVRFRTAIKEPLDIVFLFWAIAAGIVLAAGMIVLAVFGSLLIALALVVFVNKKEKNVPYILMINVTDETAEKKTVDYISAAVEKQVLKSKAISKSGIELNMEVRLKQEETGFINQIAGMEGVLEAVLVSYNGDYMS